MFNEREKDLSLKKIPFGIENIITSEGHGLKLYVTNYFDVVI
jgi:hypothetical protein